MISGKRVMDFGCGLGYQSVALAVRYNCSVVGIDVDLAGLQKATRLANSYNIPKTRVTFTDKITQDLKNSFDVVISQNSFEHFSDPSLIFAEMRSIIKDSGKILITFGPPWLAPYGSHMHFFCKFPWINILFSEKTVMKVRSHYRNDGAVKYEDVESGLNKMTLAKFKKFIYLNKLKITYEKYSPVKGIDFLSKIPLLKELFINRITVVLFKDNTVYPALG